MWIESDLYNALRVPAPDNWDIEDFIEVKIEDSDFLKIKETLTRIGVSNNKNDGCLFQTCHILHKQGRYYIVHFKELFILDGRVNNLFIEDILRRDYIAWLLETWGLVEIVQREPAVHLPAYLLGHEDLIKAFSKTSHEDEETLYKHVDEMYYFVSHKTKIIRFAEKDSWKLVPKYQIGVAS